MTVTKTSLIVGVICLAVIAAAVTVKCTLFPAIKDDYFAMNARTLGEVPFGLVVLRPTHFPSSARKGVVWGAAKRSGSTFWRAMGRNVSLNEVFGVAYDKAADRVVLPASAPHNNFDFLVTIKGDQRAALQQAIRKQLGYTAHMETRDTQVLVLKTNALTSSRLIASAADAKPNVHPDKGRLYFSHITVQELMQGLEHVAKLPIVDRSTLTGGYDFSITFGPQIEHQLQNEATAPAVLAKILGEIGLSLEPDEDKTEMLVVERAK